MKLISAVFLKYEANQTWITRIWIETSSKHLRMKWNRSESLKNESLEYIVKKTEWFKFEVNQTWIWSNLDLRIALIWRISDLNHLNTKWITGIWSYSALNHLSVKWIRSDQLENKVNLTWNTWIRSISDMNHLNIKYVWHDPIEYGTNQVIAWIWNEWVTCTLSEPTWILYKTN